MLPDFRRLAGLADDRVVSPGARELTERDLELLEGRKPFDVGTRRQWKRGEHLKTVKGWLRIKKAEAQAQRLKEPSSVETPDERVKRDAAAIQKATEKSPLLGTLTQLGSFMGKSGVQRPEGFKYGSSYEAVAAEGSPMPSEKMPAALKKSVMADIRELNPELKQCYYNAQKLALNHPDKYTYAEGYVNNGLGMPIQHGWCVMRDGGKTYLVDPTLRHDHTKPAAEGNLTVGEIPEGHEYVGKEFPMARIFDRWRSGMAGSLYDWPPYYPLMRANPDWKTARKTKAVDFGD